MNHSLAIQMLCNMFAIIHSIYISITVYKMIDSLINIDAKDTMKKPAVHKPMFRGDRTDLQEIVYKNMYFYDQDQDNDEDEDEDEDRKYEHAIPPTKDRFLKEGFEERFEIYNPIKVCYVNSYVVYDSNSTSFDYAQETEYDIEDMRAELTHLNKMYIVFDDIHMVFSIRDQQCIKYPDIYPNDNDEL